LLCKDGDTESNRVFCFNTNPTAEEMARYLGTKVERAVRSTGCNVVSVKVRIYETPSSYAEYSLYS
jgi:hypothetical protein